MPVSSRSLLSLESFSQNEILQFIDLARKYKAGAPPPRSLAGSRPVVGLAFFEPSTRTQVSFEIAALRLGLCPLTFVADGSTSVAKGESLHETLVTLLAMRPDALVIRFGQDPLIEQTVRESKIPIFNAGSGVQEHPTQALLDAMTIQEKLKTIQGQRVVYIGDVEHSRVARSGRALLTRLGAEVAVCAPVSLMPASADWAGALRFQSLAEALDWSTVAVGLRLQTERHKSEKVVATEYAKSYRLDNQSLAKFRRDGLIMHPGPFLPNVDLHEEILSDPRCVVREQVTNGVYIRMAVMGERLGLSHS
jgi:aspartate carbamoyltransferase catalytic subunit